MLCAYLQRASTSASRSFCRRWQTRSTTPLCPSAITSRRRIQTLMGRDACSQNSTIIQVNHGTLLYFIVLHWIWCKKLKGRAVVVDVWSVCLDVISRIAVYCRQLYPDAKHVGRRCRVCHDGRRRWWRCWQWGGYHGQKQVTIATTGLQWRDCQVSTYETFLG